MSGSTLLRGIGLFQGISSEDLHELAKALTVRRYKTGQLIFAQGDTGSTMYIVLKGHVRIYLPNPHNDVLLQIMKRGDYFGELALFDNEPRSASALAETNVILLELTQQALMHYITVRPHTALILLGTLSARLRATNTLLSQRAARNVDEEFEKQLTWRDRLADKIAELNGSWAFIIILVAITAGWVLLNNGRILQYPLDPYPFVFFNLLLAILVALQGPLIVMSQNRQAMKDRARAETDYQVNLKNEVNIETLLQEIKRLELEVRDRLEHPENGSNPSPELPTRNADVN